MNTKRALTKCLVELIIDKKVRNSEYHNRIYTEEELKEKIGV